MPTAAVVGTRTRPYLSSTRRSGGEAASTSATGSASASSSNVMTEADRACIFTGLRPATAIQIDRDDDVSIISPMPQRVAAKLLTSETISSHRRPLPHSSGPSSKLSRP